jgi:hypothetical protein
VRTLLNNLPFLIADAQLKRMRVLKEKNQSQRRDVVQRAEDAAKPSPENAQVVLAMEAHNADPNSTVRGICNKFKVSRQTFIRYQDNARKGLRLSGTKVGRKAWQNESQNMELINRAHDVALAKNAFDSTSKGEFVQALTENHRISQGQRISRLSAQQKPSKSTTYKYLKIVAPVKTKQPSIVNERREEALKDPYNPISTAAMLYAALDVTEECPNGSRFLPWNVTNTDTQCTMLGTAKKITARTPDGVSSLLKSLRLSVSRKETKTKVRSVKHTPTIAMSGELICFCSVIKERQCKEVKFFSFQMGGYILYIIFRPAASQNSVECPTDSDEDRIIELEIEDPQEVWRDNLKSMIEDGALNLEEAEDPDKVESAETKFGEMMLDKCIFPALVSSRNARQAEAGRESEEKDPILFTLDGEFGLMRALIRRLMTKWSPERIMQFKLAAAFTLASQPCDLARFFAIFNQLCQAPDFMDPPSYPAPWFLGSLVAYMSEIKMDAGSRTTFTNYFHRLPTMIGQCYTPKVISDSFVSASYYPFNPAELFAKNAQICSLEDEEMDNLIDKVIPELGEIGKSLGFISDDEIKKTLDKYDIPLETDMEHLNDKSFNRQRAVWMCHPAEVR